MRLLILSVLAMGFTGVPSAPAQPAFPDFDKLSPVKELPDPLTALDGTKITTKEQWEQKRKPELRELFQYYMYGYLPAAPKPDAIKATITRTDEKYFGGKATKKEINIAFGPPGCPTIDLLLIVPNQRSKPAPAFVGLNFRGNHTVLKDPTIPLAKGWVPNQDGIKDNKSIDAHRGNQAERWEIENTIDQGYAVATFYYGDIAPDKPDFNAGVFPFYRKEGAAPGPQDWGAVAAWAWGIHRAVDYLVTDKDIDAGRIIAFGHSRNGKAAIVAAAFDERIALAIPHQAGCGGTAPNRRKNPKGESVTRINTVFPHWFNDTFPRFNDHEDRLPFDQHCLVALCAPRPVLFTNGEKDQWADPAGQHDMLKAASPVYEKIYGKRGVTDDAAEIGKLVGDTLGYFIDAGPHTVTKEHWNTFIAFANRQLGKPS